MERSEIYENAPSCLKQKRYQIVCPQAEETINTDGRAV